VGGLMHESVFYLAGKRALMTGKINLEKDKFRLVLVRDEYEPDVELHKMYKDITYEASGIGYKKGGVPLTGQRLEEKVDEIHFHADDMKLEESSIVASAVVVVHDATDTLLVYSYSYRGRQESIEAAFVIQWSDDGILFI
jgi:hypothetical protein